MAVLKKRGALARGSIVYLPVDEIGPNPAQPRRNFHLEGLSELAESIRQHGIINPLTVRLRGGQVRADSWGKASPGREAGGAQGGAVHSHGREHGGVKSPGPCGKPPAP